MLSSNEQIAFILLALLLNTIESGASWPKGVQHGRAGFLQKNPGKPSHDVADLRILLLLPILYRKWAVYRLFSLQDWIDGWDLDGILVGS